MRNPELDRHQRQERPEQQSGADHEHERQRNLCHDERAAERSEVSTEHATCSTLLERISQIDACGLERGSEPESDARGAAQADREQEDAPVDRHVG